MEALILAGGFGTRLSTVVSEVPKPMAPIHGRPFLSYLLGYLAKAGIQKITLCTGYMHQVIYDYFGSFYSGLSISYSLEAQPLGTGGAIKKALCYCDTDDVILLNGDTFFPVDIDKMHAAHLSYGSDITVAAKELFKFDRYGVINHNEDRITGFTEKQPCSQGLINGGVYILKKNVFNNFILPEVFSFERDFLEININVVKQFIFISDSYFIDIGVPEDYAKAQLDVDVFNKYSN